MRTMARLLRAVDAGEGPQKTAGRGTRWRRGGRFWLSGRKTREELRVAAMSWARGIMDRRGQAMPGEAAEQLHDDLFKGESSWHRTRTANQRQRSCVRDGIT